MRELALSLQEVLALTPGRREWLFGATIVCGLVVDQIGHGWVIPGEYLVDACVWLVFFAVFRRTGRVERAEMLAVLAIATPLELLASEVWGLYTYRAGLMPLFVPPGHWLLFAIGRRLAASLPPSSIAPALWSALPLALGFAWTGTDATAAVLFPLLVVFVRLGPEPALYVSMVWLALAMELLGTGLGNWRWASEIPGTMLLMSNPPLLCGTAYALGDLLVASTVRLARGPRSRAALG